MYQDFKSMENTGVTYSPVAVLLVVVLLTTFCVEDDFDQIQKSSPGVVDVALVAVVALSVLMPANNFNYNNLYTQTSKSY